MMSIKVSNKVKEHLHQQFPGVYLMYAETCTITMLKKYVLIPSQLNLAFVYHTFPRLSKKTGYMKVWKEVSWKFRLSFCIRCFCFKGVYNHVHNNIVYIYNTPYNVMHLLHAEKTTIIRKQYVWQGFMSFNILFPAGTSPADCNLPSENNKVMMSLSLQRIWIRNL